MRMYLHFCNFTDTSLSQAGKRKVEALQNEVLLCLENRTESETKAVQPLRIQKFPKLLLQLPAVH